MSGLDQLGWHAFAQRSPDIAQAFERLLVKNEVAFLATVAASGRPRIHPFVPKIVGDRLIAFVMDSSPKRRDLEARKQYAIHALPGDADEECMLSGEGRCCDDAADFRTQAATAMGFVTGVDERHILYEFLLDRALWTRWLDFGTPDHRPKHTTWTA